MIAAPVVELELETKRATRPPDRWIAWFVVRLQNGAKGKLTVRAHNGRDFGPEEPFPDDVNTWPTRETCEQYGREQEATANAELAAQYDPLPPPMRIEFLQPEREGVQL